MKLKTNAVRETYLISEAENIFPTKRAKSFKEKNALLAISENSTFVKGFYTTTPTSVLYSKNLLMLMSTAKMRMTTGPMRDRYFGNW